MTKTTPTILFDLDNTLGRCSEYYDQTLDEFAAFQSERLRIEKGLALDVVNAIDLACAKQPGGFSADRFPLSFKAASVALDVLTGEALNPQAALLSWRIGREVFNAPYALYEGVEEMLAAYQAGGWRMVLITKGDEEIQQMKVLKNNLVRFFDPMHIFIVPTKNIPTLGRICDELDVDYAATWMVGDSRKDDIAPAQAFGIATVRVTHHPTEWAYEKITGEVRADLEIDDVTRLPQYLPYSPAQAIADRALFPQMAGVKASEAA